MDLLQWLCFDFFFHVKMFRLYCTLCGLQFEIRLGRYEAANEYEIFIWFVIWIHLGVVSQKSQTSCFYQNEEQRSKLVILVLRPKWAFVTIWVNKKCLANVSLCFATSLSSSESVNILAIDSISNLFLPTLQVDLASLINGCLWVGLYSCICYMCRLGI